MQLRHRSHLLHKDLYCRSAVPVQSDFPLIHSFFTPSINQIHYKLMTQVNPVHTEPQVFVVRLVLLGFLQCLENSIPQAFTGHHTLFEPEIWEPTSIFIRSSPSHLYKSISITQSAQCNSFSSCVMAMIILSFLICSRTSIKVLALCISKADVGSSKITKGAFFKKALINEIFCFSPPDRFNDISAIPACED